MPHYFFPKRSHMQQDTPNIVFVPDSLEAPFQQIIAFLRYEAYPSRILANSRHFGSSCLFLASQQQSIIGSEPNGGANSIRRAASGMPLRGWNLKRMQNSSSQTRNASPRVVHRDLIDLSDIHATNGSPNPPPLAQPPRSGETVASPDEAGSVRRRLARRTALRYRNNNWQSVDFQSTQIHQAINGEARPDLTPARLGSACL
ncbi:hypothetical protein BDV59DRAFT_74202 [Aspergillus ambiguus]|uniref:uncharacterized protein n=1 Tax=Aspergillus ambiguus TaxID=176160 RepID=UPI003CCD9D82